MSRNLKQGDIVYAQSATNEWRKYYLQGWLPMQAYSSEQFCKISPHEDNFIQNNINPCLQFNLPLTIKEKGILTIEEFREFRLIEILHNA